MIPITRFLHSKTGVIPHLVRFPPTKSHISVKNIRVVLVIYLSFHFHCNRTIITSRSTYTTSKIHPSDSKYRHITGSLTLIYIPSTSLPSLSPLQNDPHHNYLPQPSTHFTSTCRRIILPNLCLPRHLLSPGKRTPSHTLTTHIRIFNGCTKSLTPPASRA